MTDFEKFATSKANLDSMVLQDVIKNQNQYLNPYILEERQLMLRKWMSFLVL